MFSNVTEFLREVNLFMAIVALGWLVDRRLRNRELYSVPLRSDIWWFGLLWCAATVVGTIEQLFETGTTFRVGFGTAALIFTWRILWVYKIDWFRESKHGDDADVLRETESLLDSDDGRS